jgi:CrcB protein
MKQVAAVFFGGMLGTLLRFLLNGLSSPIPYPIWTWIENTGGSLVLGIITGIFLSLPKKPVLYGFLGTGLCGGFTTMSAFAKESIALFDSGSLLAAAGYMAATTASGLLSASLGIWAGKRFTNKRKERVLL